MSQSVVLFFFGGGGRVNFWLDANLPNHSYTDIASSMPTGPVPYLNNLISVTIGSSVTIRFSFKNW